MCAPPLVVHVYSFFGLVHALMTWVSHVPRKVQLLRCQKNNKDMLEISKGNAAKKWTLAVTIVTSTFTDSVKSIHDVICFAVSDYWDKRFARVAFAHY